MTGFGPPTHKRCPNCSDWLPLEAFSSNRRAHLGRSSWCRDCARAATRDWRERNRNQENAQRRQRYRDDHPLIERPCVVCGRPFAKRPDAIVCGEECRRERKLEQRKNAQRRERAVA
jgi:predicted nucleic acid-binding Zn ribbon protein